MSKVRVNCFSVSVDGYGAGPHQDLENPMGVGGMPLHEWVFPTRSFRSEHLGATDGTTGVDDTFAVRGMANLGASILGRNMFGPVRGPWPDDSWKGWWGKEPPYHVPVFVLTHHARPPLEMAGNTTFHFVTGGPEEALTRARAAAGAKDIRIGGGASTIRQYLRTGAIDEVHLAISPVLLGKGEPLLSGLDLPALGYKVTEHVAGEGATHVVLTPRVMSGNFALRPLSWVCEATPAGGGFNSGRRLGGLRRQASNPATERTSAGRSGPGPRTKDSGTGPCVRGESRPVPAQAQPRAYDWLAVHREPAQSFEEYVRDHPTGPTASRQVIVLQPLGPFPEREAGLLEGLRGYLSAYFQMEARVAEPLPLPSLGTRTRRQGNRTFVQYHTAVLLEQVLWPRLPDDAVAYLGITTADLFPDPAWNFVFGMGTYDKRVGVYSLARLSPEFNGDPDTDITRDRLTRRAQAVLAHETGHMFSLHHCSANECLMNGMNSVGELDRGTPWLCPDCLRKLHHNTGFDLRRHYQQLRAYGSPLRPEWTDWLDRRLARLGPPDG